MQRFYNNLHWRASNSDSWEPNLDWAAVNDPLAARRFFSVRSQRRVLGSSNSGAAPMSQDKTQTQTAEPASFNLVRNGKSWKTYITRVYKLQKNSPLFVKSISHLPPPAIENNRRSLKFRDVCPASPRPKTSLFNCWSISIERLEFDLICKWCTLSTRLSWLSDPGWKLLKNVFWHIPNSGGAHVSGGPTSKRTGGGSRWRQPKPHPPVKPGRKKKLPTPRQKHNWLSQRSR